MNRDRLAQLVREIGRESISETDRDSCHDITVYILVNVDRNSYSIEKNFTAGELMKSEADAPAD